VRYIHKIVHDIEQVLPSAFAKARRRGGSTLRFIPPGSAVYRGRRSAPPRA